jgi:hypothetical protein
MASMQNDPEELAGSVRMSGAEFWWALRAALAVMAVTCLPYLLCWYATPDGRTFPGILFNADDHGVYLSWMRQARDGHFFLRNLFTSEPQAGRYVHLYFWLLGDLSRLTGLPLAVSYHLGRVIAGVIALILVYRFAALFAADRFSRRTVFWTTALSAGLGWLFWGDRPLPSQPVDCWQPEAFTFQSLYTNGLFAASLALMLGVVVGLLLAQQSGKMRYAVVAGICGFVLANIHTYDVLTLGIVWAVYLVAAAVVAPRELRRRGREALVAAALAAPAAIYQVWFYLGDPVFRARVAVPTTSPPPLLYLEGYGLMLPLAAWGLWLLLRARPLRAAPANLLPPIWLLVGFALIYLPVSFQRKLAMGLHFPLALLAGLGVAQLATRLSRGAARVPRWIPAAAVVAVTAITPVLFVRRDIEAAKERNRSSTGVHPVWWPAADFAMMQWIADHLPPGAVIYCHPFNGVLMPATAGRAVYAGHWGETPGYPAKVKEAVRFFSGLDPTEPVPGRRPDLDPNGAAGSRYLRRRGVGYVFFGPMERELSEAAVAGGAPGFAPSPALRPIHQIGETVLYAVATDGG